MVTVLLSYMMRGLGLLFSEWGEWWMEEEGWGSGVTNSRPILDVLNLTGLLNAQVEMLGAALESGGRLWSGLEGSTSKWSHLKPQTG